MQIMQSSVIIVTTVTKETIYGVGPDLGGPETADPLLGSIASAVQRTRRSGPGVRVLPDWCSCFFRAYYIVHYWLFLGSPLGGCLRLEVALSWVVTLVSIRVVVLSLGKCSLAYNAHSLITHVTVFEVKPGIWTTDLTCLAIVRNAAPLL